MHKVVWKFKMLLWNGLQMRKERRRDRVHGEQEAPPALIKKSITHLEPLLTWPEHLFRSSRRLLPECHALFCIRFCCVFFFLSPPPPPASSVWRVGPVRQVWAGPSTGEEERVEEGRGAANRSALQSGRRGQHGAVTKLPGHRHRRGFSFFLKIHQSAKEPK